MKTTKEMIEVMQACERGEQIEFCYTDEVIKVWEDTNGKPLWNWGDTDYRVKPKPKYVPFETAEEFLEALYIHGEGLTSVNDVRVLNAKDIYINTDGNVLKSIGNRHYPATYYLYYLGDLKYLFENCKFVDGAPCGKEVKA